MSSPSLNSLDLSSSTFQVLRHSHNLSETLEQFILTQKQQLTHRQHTHLQVNYVEGLIEEVSSQPKKRDEKSKEEILIEEFLS